MKNRTLYFSITSLCFGALAAALFFQYHDNLEPCILCVMQRIPFLLAGIITLIAGLQNSSCRKLNYVYSFALLLLSLIGGLLATRQVWLQHLPISQRPLCAPSLDFIFSTFAPSEIVVLLFTGTGDCGDTTWQLFNLSMAVWSLLVFCGIFLLALYLIMQQRLQR